MGGCLLYCVGLAGMPQSAWGVDHRFDCVRIWWMPKPSMHCLMRLTKNLISSRSAGLLGCKLAFLCV